MVHEPCKKLPAMFGRSFSEARMFGKVGAGENARDAQFGKPGIFGWRPTHLIKGGGIDNEKYKLGPDPLTKEDSLKEMQMGPEYARNAALRKEEIDLVNKLKSQLSAMDTPYEKGQLSALGARKGEELLASASKELDNRFVTDFVEWLRGVSSKEEEYRKSGWDPAKVKARAKPISNHATVKDYLEQHTNRKLEYQKKLADMWLKSGNVNLNKEGMTLDQAWKYYKYVVRNLPATDAEMESLEEDFRNEYKPDSKLQQKADENLAKKMAERKFDQHGKPGQDLGKIVELERKNLLQKEEFEQHLSQARKKFDADLKDISDQKAALEKQLSEREMIVEEAVKAREQIEQQALERVNAVMQQKEELQQYFNSELGKAQHQIGGLQAAIYANDSRVQAKVLEKNKVSKELERMKKELQDVEGKYQSALSKHQTHAEKFSTQLRSKKDTISKLQEDLKKESHRRQELETQVGSLTSAHEAEKKRFLAKLSAGKEEVRKMSEEMEGNRRRMEERERALQQEMSKKDEELRLVQQEITAERERAGATVRELEAKLAVGIQHFQALQSSSQAYQTEIGNMYTRLHAFLQRINSLGNGSSSVQDLDHAERLITSLVEEFQSKLKTVDKQEARLAEYRHEVQGWRMQVGQLEWQVGELKKLELDLRTQLEQMHLNHNPVQASPSPGWYPEPAGPPGWYPEPAGPPGWYPEPAGPPAPAAQQQPKPLSAPVATEEFDPALGKIAGQYMQYKKGKVPADEVQRNVDKYQDWLHRAYSMPLAELEAMKKNAPEGSVEQEAAYHVWQAQRKQGADDIVMQQFNSLHQLGKDWYLSMAQKVGAKQDPDTIDSMAFGRLMELYLVASNRDAADMGVSAPQDPTLGNAEQLAQKLFRKKNNVYSRASLVNRLQELLSRTGLMTEDNEFTPRGVALYQMEQQIASAVGTHGEPMRRSRKTGKPKPLKLRVGDIYGAF